MENGSSAPLPSQQQQQPQHPRQQRRWCSYCRVIRMIGLPRAQMMAFLIAQPVTFAGWSWALHRVIPWLQVTFSSHAPVIDVLIFFLAFSVLVVGLFPLGVIDLAAGFLFGVWAGFPVALATKTSGSVLCFILSRHTCRGATRAAYLNAALSWGYWFCFAALGFSVRRTRASEYLRRTMVEHYDWLGALSLMVTEHQFRTMALLRFSVLPAALKNYGCGSLAVSLRIYASVTALALSLESFLLVPVGAKIDSLENILSREHTPLEKAAVAVGVMLLLILVYTIRRTVRLQIEQIQRDTASRGVDVNTGHQEAKTNLLLEETEVVNDAAGGYAARGKQGKIGDKAIFVEHAIL